MRWLASFLVLLTAWSVFADDPPAATYHKPVLIRVEGPIDSWLEHYVLRKLARAKELGCDLLGLSVDSLFAHIAWIANIKERFGVEVPFPIVEDPSMAVARAYGMLHPGAHTSATVRATFVIDPGGVIRAIVWYPMNVGRSVDELLRLVTALQTSDKSDVYTPEGWRPGDPVLVPPPLVARNGKGAAPTAGQTDWYFRLEPAHG